MAEPLTKAEREALEEVAREVLSKQSPCRLSSGAQGVYVRMVAGYRRYEQTLQDVEVQRDALVKALLLCEDVITRWPLTSMHTPEEDAALAAARAAIKEATDGA